MKVIRNHISKPHEVFNMNFQNSTKYSFLASEFDSNIDPYHIFHVDLEWNYNTLAAYFASVSSIISYVHGFHLTLAWCNIIFQEVIVLMPVIDETLSDVREETKMNSFWMQWMPTHGEDTLEIKPSSPDLQSSFTPTRWATSHAIHP